MVTEDHEIRNGWPLGLGNMNMRLGVVDIFQAAAAAPYPRHVPSSSFSSFSSSSLDTESTTSFFQDHSVSLGRLIGIRPGDRGILYFPNTIRYQRHGNKLEGSLQSEVSLGHGMATSRGICVPQLLNMIGKMSRSKSNTRH
ncbi:hypothetical protein RJ639_044831 [Escallonia herrerae]|uniref:Uncharacterized protein n=1 Tax=Escallonia herrerae TaxID=1293975 RepID=A0AA89B6R0_9ASTE|nr:hypothetical protein RJ639_044831 [Escallonia herrerae]